MKKFYLLLIALLLMNGLKAQYVTIPDANFVSWLQTHIPTAMNGNQLDTTSAAISTVTSASFSLIDLNYHSEFNLTGIKYLTSLKNLACNQMDSIIIPDLPASLRKLICSNNGYVFIGSFPTALDTLISKMLWNNTSSFPALPPSLKYLDCSGSFGIIGMTGSLPVTLQYLDCGDNSLNNLPTLPASLQYLNCRNNNLNSLPTLPASLQYLNCNGNMYLSSLPALPVSLQYLDCSYSPVSSLPALPSSLHYLNCSLSELTTLPSLPASLIHLECWYNQLSTLPALPASLSYLDCGHNQISALPALPASLYYFDCGNNQISVMPTLPSGLHDINCRYNNLISLPALPNNLYALECSNNQLTSLPALGDSLYLLACANNSLSSLPALPNSLLHLWCNNNQLTSLPSLHSFAHFNCSNNQLGCLPALYPFIWINDYYLVPVFFSNYWYFNEFIEFKIIPNPFTCLPNYTYGMNDTLLAYPLCMNGDPLNNPHSCNGLSGITGTVYKDTIMNCSLDVAEQRISNVHVMLYDNGNNLVAQTYTLTNGMYTFSAGPGTYTVKIDTVGVPFDVQCANPGIDSTVTLTALNPTAYNINFPVVCKSSFDIGVQSIVTDGVVFPGQSFNLIICAGDMSQWSHLNCTSGVGGQVQITVNGPVTYQGVANGALTPTAVGNVFTYNVADFGAISNCSDFGLIFSTDTTATSGNQVCFTVTVTPISGDVDPSNNTYTQCFNVSNSLDPNFKEVYPRNVPPGYNGYFTFTVHFQNTGNAPAYNIRIIDYLDSDLDLATFDVINYSHANTVSLVGNALTIRFPNIMLPDSTTNADASMGFVQYRIKPKPNLLAGAQITNTANIYFDYNAPVATNTTTNIFEIMTGVEESPSANTISILPNPASNKLFISGLAQDALAEIFDISGKLLLTKLLLHPQLDISSLAQGLYFIKLTTAQGSVVKKFVKE